VRSLRLRGRAVSGPRDAIWVGVPSVDPGPSLAHVTWQAAHEATVLEVQDAARERSLVLDHDSLEHAAVVLLATRAADASRSAAHAEWLAHFGANAPPTARGSLVGDAASLVDALTSSRTISVQS
jgi:hypothetical protein